MKLSESISIRFMKAAAACAFMAASISFCGCGSDGSTGPEDPKGTYDLTGTVTLDDLDDHSGVAIRVSDADSTVATVFTAADGAFTLPALGNGDYTLKARKDFYSTLTRALQVRDSLLVDPIGQLQMTRTFFIYMRSDSLNYTYKSDSVFVWMVLKNNNVEKLDLFNGFVKPYDFLIYDPAQGDQPVWQWSDIRPPVNDEKFDFVASIAAGDSMLIPPHIAWNKKDTSGTFVRVGSYDVEGWLDLVDSRGRYWYLKTEKHRIGIVP